MQKKIVQIIFICLLIVSGLSACQTSVSTKKPEVEILAVESFLADIVSNIAGDRYKVTALIPTDIDPHSFEVTPRDVARIHDCAILVINGSGLEQWLVPVLGEIGLDKPIISASEGLTPRVPSQSSEFSGSSDEVDPHFWLDPIQVIAYSKTIQDALIKIDPEGAAEYQINAQNYITELTELDAWIESEVEQIPLERRLLVTNHESFGYFADRYKFKIIGTIIPSTSTGASPSAQQLAELVDAIKQSKAPAIFLETGTNPVLAEQISQEIKIKVVTGLLTHSISTPDGLAPTYINMMRYNTELIVKALE